MIFSGVAKSGISTMTDLPSALKIVEKMHKNHTVVSFPLNKDFATFKNNLKENCTKDYIFQIDADEYLSETLLEYLTAILEDNTHIEMLLF